MRFMWEQGDHVGAYNARKFVRMQAPLRMHFMRSCIPESWLIMLEWPNASSQITYGRIMRFGQAILWSPLSLG